MLNKSSKYKPSLENARYDLLNGSPPSTGGEWVTDLTKEEAYEIALKAFSGNLTKSGEPIMEWMVNHFDFNRSMKSHTIGFMLNFVFATAMAKSPLVISKSMNVTVADADNQAYDQEEELVSVAVINEWEYKKERKVWVSWIRNWRYIKSFTCTVFSKNGIPKVFTDPTYKTQVSHFEKKSEELGPLYKWHNIYGPKDKHWYIELVGVDPDFQGIGIGREMMERIVQLADEQVMGCYLEASSDRHRDFYQQFGFSVRAIKILNDSFDTSQEPLYIYLMTRDAKQI